jgi:hypothetical protein
MKKEKKKFIYWTPRIVSMAFILFLALFSLDVFDMNLGPWDTLIGLFMHNIPSLVLLGVLIISWRHEIVGGIVFILFGLWYCGLIIYRVIMSNPPEWYMLSWPLTIAGPAFLVGILFIIGWVEKKKSMKDG